MTSLTVNNSLFYFLEVPKGSRFHFPFYALRDCKSYIGVAYLNGFEPDKIVTDIEYKECISIGVAGRIEVEWALLFPGKFRKTEGLNLIKNVLQMDPETTLIIKIRNQL